MVPLVAFNFAIALVREELYHTYNKMLNNIEKQQDFSLLGPMHTILSGLKALITNNVYEGCKIVRECCGAAGFGRSGGIASLIFFVSAFVTLEGDSIVMYL